jgi:hypothetical protein
VRWNAFWTLRVEVSYRDADELELGSYASPEFAAVLGQQSSHLSADGSGTEECDSERTI